MQPEGPKPASYKNEQEFFLSGAVTIELIQAAFAKDVFFRFKAKGFSMSPFIRDNDIITLSPVSLSPIGLGKAVACVCPMHKKLLVHRIVGRRGNHYLIKGDNVPNPDCLVDKGRILGCVTAIERKNKTFLFGLGPERIIIVFLSRIVLFSFASSLWRITPEFLRRFIKCRVPL